MKTNNFGTYIDSFIYEYLPHQKGSSPETILSYRDAIKLFLRFSATHNKKPVDSLILSDVSQTVVVCFLDYLEKERGNSRQTRNNRLSCLHSLFRYIANHDPLTFNHCQRIQGVPSKRAQISTIKHLEREEVKAILEATNRTTKDGSRDYLLFCFMYETAARVREVTSLPAKALQLEARPFQVRFMGKGARERLTPLLPTTAKLLRHFLKQQGISPKADDLVFLNHNGKQLTRQGVRYLLRKYGQIADKNCPSLKGKRIYPHILRHSCACHLLEAGVDINTVRAWLGHAQLSTTNRYAQISPEMKRKILEKHFGMTKCKRPPWKQGSRLLERLEAL
ncbi:MAG: tyrosine-type recombinase/integrase [Candidatus Bathyarchaeota archaeon]